VPVEALKEGGWREVAAIDAKLAAGEIDEAGWHQAMAELLRPAYLTAPTPWEQSGKGGDQASWAAARRFIVQALQRDGTFLDCGCANGYLMECVQRWAAEEGLRIEPYGLDIVGEFVDLARARLPHWATRIWQGNVLHWTPPMRFDVVRVGLEYVPAHRRLQLVGHLLDAVVAEGGRLLIGPYTEEAQPRTIERDLAAWGYPASGRLEVAHRDPRVVRRLVWVDASPAASR
jgi:hypothetical protein